MCFNTVPVKQVEKEVPRCYLRTGGTNNLLKHNINTEWRQLFDVKLFQLFGIHLLKFSLGGRRARYPKIPHGPKNWKKVNPDVALLGAHRGQQRLWFQSCRVRAYLELFINKNDTKQYNTWTLFLRPLALSKKWNVNNATTIPSRSLTTQQVLKPATLTSFFADANITDCNRDSIRSHLLFPPFSSWSSSRPAVQR